MDEKNKIDYLILSSEFIKSHYLENQCSNEVSRLLSLEPEFDWSVITELDLTLLNIVHITGLRLVTNLKVLKLTQNHITKIENLDCLTKLEHLDLSCNKITKIENLENLTAITFLSLSSNEISKLENLDANLKLETFFINDNKIIDINEIFYMKDFKYLRSMDVSKNPGTDNCRRIIIDQFPGLTFLNAKKITKLERSIHEALEDDHRSIEDPVTIDTGKKHLAFLNDTDGEKFMMHLYKDVDDKILSKWNSDVKKAFTELTREMTRRAMDLLDLSMDK